MTESTGEWQKELDLKVFHLDLIYPSGEIPKDLTRFLKDFYNHAFESGKRVSKPNMEDLKDFAESFKDIMKEVTSLTFDLDDKADDLKTWIINVKKDLEKEAEAKNENN